ncbi:hypothetical protein EON63_22365 [archaeon]|nr:MAG: hypothetical protein EON63_22365 [archaeon]
MHMINNIFHTHIPTHDLFHTNSADFWDKRCISSILRKYYNPRLLHDDYVFSDDGVYFAPPEGELMVGILVITIHHTPYVIIITVIIPITIPFYIGGSRVCASAASRRSTPRIRVCTHAHVTHTITSNPYPYTCTDYTRTPRCLCSRRKRAV